MADTNEQTRLILLWEHPMRWSIGVVEEVAGEATAALRQDPRVQQVELVRLEPPSPKHPAWFQWLLEIKAGSAADARSIACEETVRDLRLELRSLRLHSVLLVASSVSAARPAT